MNKVILIGNTVRPIELRYLPSGSAEGVQSVGRPRRPRKACGRNQLENQASGAIRWQVCGGSPEREATDWRHAENVLGVLARHPEAEHCSPP